MSKGIRFAVTDEQMEITRFAAATKGLIQGRFAKLSLFAQVNQYPSKGATCPRLAAKRSRVRPTDDSQGDSQGIRNDE